AWVLRKLGTFKKHANEISDIRLGSWWTISLGLVTPVALGYLMYALLKQNIARSFERYTENYEGYPDALIDWGDWSVEIGAFIMGVLVGFMKWKTKPEEGDYDDR